MTHVSWPTTCIFGDSIVMGTGASDWLGWPYIFKKWSIANSPVKDEVFPLGVSGDTVADVLQRIELECKARLPKTIIIAVGLNDAMTEDDGRPTPLDEFTSNYQKVVDIAKTFTDKIILVGINQVDERALTYVYKTDPVAYDAAIKLLASSNGLPFIDVYPLIGSELLFDGAHPNDEGHKLIADLVCQEVQRLG